MTEDTHNRRETAHKAARILLAVVVVASMTVPMLAGSAAAQSNETEPCAFGPPVPGQQPEEDVDELEVAVTFDESNSMNQSNIDALKNATGGFVDRLSSPDEVGLVTIDRNSQVLHNLTRNYDAVHSTIDGIQVDGTFGNDFADAINNSRDVLLNRSNATDGATKVMIFGTDGEPGSAAPVGPIYDAAEQAREAGITIYSVGIPTPTTNETFLETVAGSEDRVYLAPEPEDLDIVYETISSDIETLQSEGLRIDTRDLFKPGAEHPYEVTNVRYVLDPETNETETIRTDVTESANLTSSNTSVLSVDEANTQLVATDDANTSTWVRVDAETANASGCTNVIVAQATLENLELVPGIWRINAVIGNSTLFALLIATLLAVPAARFTSAFGGLAMAELVLIVGWFGGYVSFGIAATSLFTALFIGLNLAANIDYQAGRLR